MVLKLGQDKKEKKSMFDNLQFTQYIPLTRLDIKKGTSITQKDIKKGNIKVVASGKDFAYLHDISNREAGTITISASGEAGYINYWEEPIFASDCITINTDDIIETKFIYYYLKCKKQDSLMAKATGQSQSHVYIEDVSDIVADIPHIANKQQIVDIIDNLSDRISTMQDEIDVIKQKKMTLLNEYFINR